MSVKRRFDPENLFSRCARCYSKAKRFPPQQRHKPRVREKSGRVPVSAGKEIPHCADVASSFSPCRRKAKQCHAPEHMANHFFRGLEVARCDWSSGSELLAVHRVLTKPLFDAEKLIILRSAIGAAEGTSFDLAAVRRHREIRNGRVFRFTGAMA